MKYDDIDVTCLLIKFIDYIGDLNFGKRLTKKQSHWMRIFIYACQKKGFTDASIARILKKHPSVIRYHIKKITETEKQKALEFLKWKIGRIFEAWS